MGLKKRELELDMFHGRQRVWVRWGPLVARVRSLSDKAAKWTAADIAKTAKRSIKIRKKRQKDSRYSTAIFGDYPTSPAGEPPFSHTGVLRKSIIYARESPGTWLVGPVQHLSRSDGARALERGGYSIQKKRLKKPEYDQIREARLATVARPESSKRRPLKCPKHGTPRLTRPTSQHGKKQYQYRYFYSYEEWKAATASEKFLHWANMGTVTKEIPINVTPHPFMAPAMAREMDRSRMDARLERAAK